MGTGARLVRVPVFLPPGEGMVVSDEQRPVYELQKELDILRENYLAGAPAEHAAVIQRAVTELVLSGIVEHAAAVGDRAQDFTLPNAGRLYLIYKKNSRLWWHLPFIGEKHRGGLGFFPAAKVTEEITQHRCAFFPADAGGQPYLMIQARVRREIIKRPGGAALGVITAENDPFEPGEDNGPHAHEARLQRHVQSCARQTPVCRPAGSLPDGDHFGMGGGIVATLAEVVPPANHRTVAHDNGPDRNFVTGRGLCGLPNCLFHPIGIVTNGLFFQ